MGAAARLARLLWWALPALLCAAGGASAQGQDAGTPSDVPSQEKPVESDLGEAPERKIVPKWSEYDLKLLTFRWGIYAIFDAGTSAQNAASVEQVDVNHDVKVRDLRFTVKGRFNLERSVTYTMGLMYDGPSNSWFPRETGIQIAIPELYGNVFVGRQKEGLSLNKITVGYAVWTMERAPINEATIPIMNDGIKWLGGLPNQRANWNVAYFHNFLPKNPATGWYDNIVAARLAVLPMLTEHDGALLHLGVGYHWANYSDGEAQLRARPESSTAPYFLDTGVFPARDNHLVVLEAYFQKGPWLCGAEYFLNAVRAPEVGNPLFHGGEAFVAWVVTGEVRPYYALGGKLGFVQPEDSAFQRGPGAVELVLHASYADFDGGNVQGGRFFRLTPQLNWHIDSMVELELNYGLGVLDRFSLTGLTHFFQARIKVMIN